MNRPNQTQDRYDRLLARWGGSYIVRMQSLTQLISLIAASIGIYYIYVTAKFTSAQIQQLLISVFGCMLLASLLLSIFTGLSARQARARLNQIFKGKPAPPDTDEEDWVHTAWKEVIRLPSRYGNTELLTVYILVVLPTVLFMVYVGGATPIQALHVVIGGLVSATCVVVQNTLLLDRMLAPVRRALLPEKPEHQEIRDSLRVQTRLIIVVGTLFITAIMMMVPLAYQKMIYSAMTGAALDFRQYVQQASIMGGLLLVLGFVLLRLLAQSVSQPVREMVRTMDEIQAGHSTRRANMVSSDETAELTLRLNLLLDELGKAQQELARMVDERTADLTHKTTQLQAAAQVAREASALQDVNVLLTRTVDLISDRFGFYHTGIFLLDEQREYAILQAASSEGGKRMLARGHRLEVGRQGIVGAAASQNRPHISMDVGADKSYFKNPDLPMTQSEAAIPLTGRGKVIGVLDIQSTEPAAFTQSDIDIFQTLADQIGLAIQNARLVAESQEALQRLEAATAESMRSVWRERARGPKRAYRYTSAGLGPLTRSTRQASTDAESAQLLSIPITLRGQRIGAIGLHRASGSEWTESDRSLATEIADQVGLALENARLLDEAQRRATQEQALSELTARLSRSLDPEELLQTAIRELHQLPNVSEVSVYVTPPRSPSADEAQSPK